MAQILYLLVFLSGMAGLVYEIVWMRQVSLIFGVSIYAVSTVTAAVMLGMAVGALAFGKLADRIQRPVALYGGLELGLAAFAVLFPVFYSFTQKAYLALHDLAEARWWIIGLRFGLATMLLLAPMILMGGTLPALGKAFSGAFRRFGRSLAMLYGINTLGAVVGAAWAGFWALPVIGARGATLVAAGSNVIAGAAALWLSRSGKAPASPAGGDDSLAAKRTAAPAASGAHSVDFGPGLLPAIFLTGLCALGYEVLWTKILILFLGNSAWAFSTVLVVFLTSLALGSLIIAPWLDGKIPRGRLFVFLQSGVALLAAFSLLAFRWLAAWQHAGPGESLGGVLLVQFGVSAGILLPPTLLLGAILPLAARMHAVGAGTAGRRFGEILAANTAGAVLGALLTGFVLVGIIGVQNSLLVLAAINGGVAVGFSRHLAGRRKAARILVRTGFAAIPVALLVALFLFKPLLLAPPPGYEMKYYREDATGVVSIFQNTETGTKVFSINNVTEVATDATSMTTFRLMAYLPVLLHENAQNVLVVTFGAGIVAGSLAQLDLHTLECVEINPNAREAGRFFSRENHNVLHARKLQLHIEDGRNFLLTTDRQYDIITADATHPTGADSWVLFTKEYYTLCRERLRSGGLFLQWLPLHALSQKHFKTILATASAVFDDLTVWYGGAEGAIGHTLLIGSKGELAIDLARMRRRLAQRAIADDLRRAGFPRAENILSVFITDKEHLAPLLAHVPVNTDDRAPTAFPDAVPQKTWTAENTRLLLAAYASPEIKNMTRDAAKHFEDLHAASGRLLQAATAASLGDRNGMMAAIDHVEAAGSDPAGFGMPQRQAARLVAQKLIESAEDRLREQKLEQAKQLLERAGRIGDLAPEILVTVSRLYQKMDEPDRAFSALRQATALLPSGETFFALGTLAAQLGRDEQAIAAFRAALRLEPDLAIAYTNLGMVYARRGEMAKARTAWQKALQRNPDDALAKRNLQRLNQQKR